MAKSTDSLGSTIVKKSHVEYVVIYEVKESELSLLETGAKSGVFLDICIFLFSMALTSIGTLVSATFKQSWCFNLFLFLAVIGTIGGIILLVLWFINRKSVAKVISEIKSRLKDN